MYRDGGPPGFDIRPCRIPNILGSYVDVSGSSDGADDLARLVRLISSAAIDVGSIPPGVD